ncbi:MAG: glycosyltransferase family 39 protein [Lachnospiraceae bacterium]|nr:glycosyltransferase family 39 protein [Lachnospiraceae bacterium]
MRGKAFLFCLVISAAVLMICTKSSFLYPLNDWVDSNCFYTVGKSMIHGKVLYRDIYEQKGPLLYMIHAVAYVISPGSFTGVYLFEVLAAAVFLFCVYRTLKEYCMWAAVITLPILAALVYSAPSLSYGDSAEEFCVPMYALCLLVSFSALQRDEEVSRGGFFLAGATGACVLWIKYTMLGFFVGWFIVPAVIALRKGGFRKLFSSIGWVLAGVGAVSLPILLYFAVNGALGDLWQVYFYDNMFLYADVEISETQTLWEKLGTILETAWLSTKWTFKRNIQYALLTEIGLVWILLKEKWSMKFHMVTVLVLTCLTVYGMGRGYVYYGFILAVFSFVGLIPLCKLLGRIRMDRVFCGLSTALTGVLAVLLAYMISGNTYLMSYEKEDMPQYQFAEIINRKENATLLNYGFLDGGFYTAAGIVPNTRFFCYLNIPLPDVMDSQRAVVANGEVDFVVTRTYELRSENYECVAESSMFFAGKIYDYYLYQLKDAAN